MSSTNPVGFFALNGESHLFDFNLLIIFNSIVSNISINYLFLSLRIVILMHYILLKFKLIVFLIRTMYCTLLIDDWLIVGSGGKAS